VTALTRPGVEDTLTSSNLLREVRQRVLDGCFEMQDMAP
jgi:hypothetical protein